MHTSGGRVNVRFFGFLPSSKLPLTSWLSLRSNWPISDKVAPDPEKIDSKWTMQRHMTLRSADQGPTSR
ncbi:hypothetical protein FBZ94_11717 [Bradyrhizobium sacchari]|nr:hypothetical protein FBZ94_11717 [Bradyrhizobium sacchari]